MAPRFSKKTVTDYYRLTRPEATLLADHARHKGMDLPQGWLSFYRLTPEEITKRFSQLTIEEVVKEARMNEEAFGVEA